MLRNLFFIAFGALLAVDGLAQCEYTLSLDAVLGEGQLASASTPPLSGDLTSVTFNLNFSGTGASYPADMMAYIYAPNGECVVWGGWNIPPTGGCTDIGTGFANSWPNNWSTSLNGFYTYELPTAAWNLVGTGEWTITVQNAWTGSAPATYDLDVIFSGVCPGDCDDPVACNYVAGTTLGDPDLCEYAIDVYPSGYYDCDGNCYNDDDGDGVCNELEVAGCQVLWACNYNALATDPPPILRMTKSTAMGTVFFLNSFLNPRTRPFHAMGFQQQLKSMSKSLLLPPLTSIFSLKAATTRTASPPSRLQNR